MQARIPREQSGAHLNVAVLPVLAFLIAVNMMLPSAAFAIDPPANVRMDGDVLRWDEMPDAFEYHIYYFEGRVPSSAVVGNYLNVTTGTSWSLGAHSEPFGYYTVVAVRVDDQYMPVEFSAVTDGEIVAYLEPSENTATVVSERRCDDMVAGSSCTATCSAPAIPTGGACRAD